MIEQKMEMVSWAFQSLCSVCAIMRFIVFQFLLMCVRAGVRVCVRACVVMFCLSTFKLSSPPPRCLFSKAAY